MRTLEVVSCEYFERDWQRRRQVIEFKVEMPEENCSGELFTTILLLVIQ
jgi:hypothetical protein